MGGLPCSAAALAGGQGQRGRVLPKSCPWPSCAVGPSPWHCCSQCQALAHLLHQPHSGSCSSFSSQGHGLCSNRARCAADFTGLPGTPGLQLRAPSHCTPQRDAPQPGTPGHCIIQHPTPCACLGTGGSVGWAGVQGGGQGWCALGTGKLPCRLSARARGRRSLPRAVCSGSVPRGAGTTSNRAEPGRCLREGTEMLTVPPGAGHPRSGCRHLIAWPTQVASSTRDHPVTDAGAQGVLA